MGRSCKQDSRWSTTESCAFWGIDLWQQKDGCSKTEAQRWPEMAFEEHRHWCSHLGRWSTRQILLAWHYLKVPHRNWGETSSEIQCCTWQKAWPTSHIWCHMKQMPPSLSLQGQPNLTQSSLQGLNLLFFSFFMTLMQPNQSSLKTMDCWYNIMMCHMFTMS